MIRRRQSSARAGRRRAGGGEKQWIGWRGVLSVGWMGGEGRWGGVGVLGRVRAAVGVVDGGPALGKRSASSYLRPNRSECVFDEDSELETCSDVSCCWRI